MPAAVAGNLEGSILVCAAEWVSMHGGGARASRTAAPEPGISRIREEMAIPARIGLDEAAAPALHMLHRCHHTGEAAVQSRGCCSDSSNPDPPDAALAPAIGVENRRRSEEDRRMGNRSRYSTRSQRRSSIFRRFLQKNGGSLGGLSWQQMIWSSRSMNRSPIIKRRVRQSEGFGS